jgi:ribosomal protein S18 acetylase RimI-like enzyme
MSKLSPHWPAGAADAADWPRLAGAWGSPRRTLVTQGRRPSHVFFEPGTRLTFSAIYYPTGTRGILYLLQLQLIPQAHRRGLGGFLMHKLEELAREQSKSCVMLTVFKANTDAVRFYEKHGYEVDENSPSQCHEPKGGYEIMSKEVGQVRNMPVLNLGPQMAAAGGEPPLAEQGNEET